MMTIKEYEDYDADQDKKTFEIIKFGPLEWMVLERKDNTALIITKDALDMGKDGRYHRTDIIDPDGGLELKNKLIITWEQCDLRKVLHGIFLKEYFQKEELAKIIEVTNENPDNPWFKNPRAKNMETARQVSGGNPTKDKVFCLSVDEVCRYFGDSTEALKNKKFVQIGYEKYEALVPDANGGRDSFDHRRISDKNDFNRRAIKHERPRKNLNYGLVDPITKFKHKYPYLDECWWLRTPGNSNDRAIYVGGGSSNGHIFMEGDSINVSNCVRPALWIQV